MKYAHRDKQVVDIAGDGSLQMVVQEFATAVNEDLPVVVCLLNNNWLGMVRQWQKLFNDKRYSGTDLQRNPDFVMLAKAYGADAIKVERPSELREAFLKAPSRPTCRSWWTSTRTRRRTCCPMQPGGKSSKEVIRGRCRWQRTACARATSISHRPYPGREKLNISKYLVYNSEKRSTNEKVRKMAKIYHDSDADFGVLKGKKIAVIGFGSQGKAQSMCLQRLGLERGRRAAARTVSPGTTPRRTA